MRKNALRGSRAYTETEVRYRNGIRQTHILRPKGSEVHREDILLLHHLSYAVDSRSYKDSLPEVLRQILLVG